MIVPERLRALIVDDNAYARGAMAATLRKLGLVSIVEADSGMEALALLASADFDVLFLDWYMPEISGAGLLQVVRDPRFGKAETLPVIVVTAYDSPENISRARALGVSEVLSKPFTSDGIAVALGNVLKSGWTTPAAEGEKAEDTFFL